MRNQLLGCLFSLMLIMISPSLHAETAASEWVTTPHTALRLVSSHEQIDRTALYAMVGLHFKLNDGWHIYWRTPGASGLPPQISDKSSSGFSSTRMRWPVPIRMDTAGLVTYGYGDEVIIPVFLLQPSGDELNINWRVDYLACKDICIPYSADLQLSIARGESEQLSEHDARIRHYLNKAPLEENTGDLSIQSIKQVSDNKLEVRLITGARMTANDVKEIFIEPPSHLLLAEPVRLNLGHHPTVATWHVDVIDRGGQDVVGQSITVTASGEPISVMQTLRVEQSTEQAITMHTEQPPQPHTLSIWTVLFGGLIGGFILNLMPCVLPVLSLKVLKVVQAADQQRSDQRRQLLWTIIGIMSSFILLAVLIIILKAAGQAVGWGIQFQHPGFLTFLTLIMVAFAGNLWGLFEIQLPDAWQQKLFTASTPASSSLSAFLTGAFATLMATPCTAPFLGASLGAALVAPAPMILLTFIAVSIGFASPYVALLIRPQWLNYLPKPGSWMIIFKKMMAIFMLLAALWLGSVLWVQVGADVVLNIVGVMLLSIVCFTLAPLTRINRLSQMMMITAWLLLALTPTVPYLTPPDTTAVTPPSAASTVAWQSFAPEKNPQLIADGNVVFIDLTADWCITCQVNKRLVLNHDSIVALLAQPHVVAMRGDWTNPDPRIADYLKRYQRAGIPFNQVFGPSAPEGIVLPELLSREAVKAALSEAGINAAPQAR